MSTAKSRMSALSLLLVLVVVLISSTAEKAAGIRIIPQNAASSRPLHTIYSEDGDIIDCVDIYQQPAFSNPMMKGHSIKMMPTNYKQEDGFFLEQTWHKSGSCPQDTVPILRHILGSNITEPVFFRPVVRVSPKARQEDVSAYVSNEKHYYGSEAQFFTFSAPPVLMPNEFSISYVALGSKINSTFDDPGKHVDYPDIENVVAAGYMVYPNVNSDLKPRTFVYFNNPLSGCFNLDCGFVQVNKHFLIGASNPFTSDSTLDVQIQKDDAQGLWWVSFNRQLIGYYPMELFKGFFDANVVQWGGLILNTFPDEAHTATAMGSGMIASSAQADLIGDISVITKRGVEIVDHPDGVNTPFPGCYSYLERNDLVKPGHGFYFSYGGTGFPHCDG